MNTEEELVQEASESVVSAGESLVARLEPEAVLLALADLVPQVLLGLAVVALVAWRAREWRRSDRRKAVRS